MSFRQGEVRLLPALILGKRRADSRWRNDGRWWMYYRHPATGRELYKALSPRRLEAVRLANAHYTKLVKALNDPVMEAWLLARSLGSVRAKIALSVALGDRGKVIKAAIAKVRAAEVTDTAEAGPHTPRPASDGPEPGP
jgi:hypothetical protein